jgi:hypothetical protein
MKFLTKWSSLSILIIFTFGCSKLTKSQKSEFVQIYSEATSLGKAVVSCNGGKEKSSILIDENPAFLNRWELDNRKLVLFISKRKYKSYKTPNESSKFFYAVDIEGKVILLNEKRGVSNEWH